MNKLQSTVGTIVVVAVVSGIANWAVTAFLSSPGQLSASVSQTQTDIAVIKTRQDNTDKNVDDLSKNIEYTRRLVEAIATKQGISIKQP